MNLLAMCYEICLLVSKCDWLLAGDTLLKHLNYKKGQCFDQQGIIPTLHCHKGRG